MWLHDFNMWSEESEFGPETRSYPLKNKAKGEEFSLFLCTVPGAQVSSVIAVAERAGGAAPPAALCAARLGEGRKGEVTFTFPLLKCSVLSTLEPPSNPCNPTSCMSSANRSSPRVFLAWPIVSEHQLTGQSNLEDAAPLSSAHTR